VTLDERLDYQDQWLASIDRNLASLVEVQQKTEHPLDVIAEGIAALRQGVDEIGSRVDVFAKLSVSLSGAMATFTEPSQRMVGLLETTNERIVMLTEVLQRLVDYEFRRQQDRKE